MATPEAPDDVPTWATTATVPDDREEPVQERQDAGWPALLPPAHETFNWWQWVVGQWTEFVHGTARVFNDLGDANAFIEDPPNNLGPGNLLTVFEDDNASGPGITQDTLVVPGSLSTGYVDASGDVVALVDGGVTGVPRLLDRDLTLIVNLTLTNVIAVSGTIIRTNGTVTVLVYDTFVEAFNLAGVSLWIVDFGTVSPTDMCMVANGVYVTHALTTLAGDVAADRQLHKLNLATGAIVWDYQHSGAAGIPGRLASVAANGRQVFVAGAASDLGSLATVRAIGANSGSDAAGEGGNGTNVDGLAWDLAGVTADETKSMDADGLLLYIGRQASAAFQLEALGQATGEVAWQYAHADATRKSRMVSCDQDYVYVCYTEATNSIGFMLAQNKHTGAPVWRFGAPSGGGVASGNACVSDGMAVWFLGGPDDANLRRLTRGNVPTQFRVIDAATEFVRFRNWRLQPSDQ